MTSDNTDKIVTEVFEEVSTVADYSNSSDLETKRRDLEAELSRRGYHFRHGPDGNFPGQPYSAVNTEEKTILFHISKSDNKGNICLLEEALQETCQDEMPSIPEGYFPDSFLERIPYWRERVDPDQNYGF